MVIDFVVFAFISTITTLLASKRVCVPFYGMLYLHCSAAAVMFNTFM